MKRLDRPTLEGLLPCYLCGDLPDWLNRRVEQELQQDPALQALLEEVRGGREACEQALRTLSAAVPELDLQLDLGPLQGRDPSA